MMKDKNFVFLEGTIGDDYCYKKTRDGKDFATFSLIVNSYDSETHDKTEKSVYIQLRIMVFDPIQIQYLKGAKPQSGYRASILGRLNTHSRDHKGMYLTFIDVVVRDIHIVKTNK